MSHRVLRDPVKKETSKLEDLSALAVILWQQVERRFFRDKEHKGGHPYKKTSGSQHSASLIFGSEGE